VIPVRPLKKEVDISCGYFIAFHTGQKGKPWTCNCFGVCFVECHTAWSRACNEINKIIVFPKTPCLHCLPWQRPVPISCCLLVCWGLYNPDHLILTNGTQFNWTRELGLVIEVEHSATNDKMLWSTKHRSKLLICSKQDGSSPKSPSFPQQQSYWIFTPF
jgi:hypothetical protein